MFNRSNSFLTPRCKKLGVIIITCLCGCRNVASNEWSYFDAVSGATDRGVNHLAEAAIRHGNNYTRIIIFVYYYQVKKFTKNTFIILNCKFKRVLNKTAIIIIVRTRIV